MVKFSLTFVFEEEKIILCFKDPVSVFAKSLSAQCFFQVS